MTTRIRSPVVPAEAPSRALTRPEFHQLAAMPGEAEWFANLDDPRTRGAYRVDLQEFMGFAGITRPDEFRLVTRARVLAWRAALEERLLSGATIRRKLAALSSLFEYLCEKNTIDFNPVKGAKRPEVDSGEGKTAALGDHMEVTSPISGQATLSPDDAKMFEAGDIYVNVHAKNHPNGEIRGQVVPPKSN